ncbi:SRPBCC domain-containing protein [Massilia sp. W12]|uniref:SRPBCC domain-containing protein n=1 Tax=Massilia sp. W12 TaxID=3126507 RepID=UPI0030CC5AEB
MSSLKHIQFNITIHAPASTVWRTVTEADSYQRWTSAFSAGSYYEGSWEEGAKIRFLAQPSGDGMLSEIAQSRKDEFISIRHLGMISNGVEDTSSDAVRAWAPCYENYTFVSIPAGVNLLIELDVPAEWEQFMNEAWPQALLLLKQLSEQGATG